MARRRAGILAVGISALCVSGTVLSAQNRFEVLTQNVMAEVSGLRIVTIRDNQLSACYTLFIMEPPGAASAAPEAVVSAPAPSDDPTQQSIQRIREASEKRDRQRAELKAQFERKVGRPYEAWTTPGVAPDPFLVGDYERDRRKIDDEYEHVVRTEIPGSYPYAVLVPGMRTGGWEDAANAVRRAALDPDPTSAMKTMAGQLAHIDEQLKRLIEAPRLAASGPVACGRSGAKTNNALP